MPSGMPVLPPKVYYGTVDIRPLFSHIFHAKKLTLYSPQGLLFHGNISFLGGNRCCVKTQESYMSPHATITQKKEEYRTRVFTTPLFPCFYIRGNERSVITFRPPSPECKTLSFGLIAMLSAALKARPQITKGGEEKMGK